MSATTIKTNRTDSSVRTRVTIFNSNAFYVPDLRLKNDGPGPAKYSQPISTIQGPAFSFGREGRLHYERLLKEKTPDHYCYPIKDRCPSFIMGRVSSRKSAASYSNTPSPTHYTSELAFKSTKPNVPICRFGKADRFTKYISVF